MNISVLAALAPLLVYELVGALCMYMYMYVYVLQIIRALSIAINTATP